MVPGPQKPKIKMEAVSMSHMDRGINSKDNPSDKPEVKSTLITLVDPKRALVGRFWVPPQCFLCCLKDALAFDARVHSLSQLSCEDIHDSNICHVHEVKMTKPNSQGFFKSQRGLGARLAGVLFRGVWAVWL